MGAIRRFDSERLTAPSRAIEPTLAGSEYQGRPPAVDKAPQACTLYLQIQTRFHKNQEGVLLTSASWARYSAWKQYLQGIDEIVLLARVSDEVNENGHAVEGPGVSVQPMPFYNGIGGLIIAFSKIRGFINHLPEGPNVLYGGRAADPVTNLLQRKAKKAGTHFVLQVVGDPAESLRVGSFGRLGRIFARPMSSWVTRQVRDSSAVIYVTRSVLQARYPPKDGALTLARSSIEFTPESFAENARDYVGQRVRYPLRLITVGGHSQQFKGHDLLLQAIAELRQRGVETTTVIVGAGRYHDHYKSLARRLDVEGCVAFVGHLSDPQSIRDLISQADVFVLPSLTEGLPRALLEAMARGIASIASNVGGNSELLPTQAIFDAGSASSIVDHILKLKDSPELLTELARDSLHRAHQVEKEQSGALILGRFLRELVSTEPSTSRVLINKSRR